MEQLLGDLHKPSICEHGPWAGDDEANDAAVRCQNPLERQINCCLKIGGKTIELGVAFGVGGGGIS